MRRLILAYLAIVILGAWVFYTVEDVAQGDDLARAPIAAVATLLGSGLVLLPFVVLLFIPAMALTIRLVHRFEATSRAARSALGAASWAG